MALNVIMMGPPGSGKGTQAERFAGAHGIPKISTGDILREAVQAGTELGRVAKATMDAGGLVSDEIIIGVVRERLQRPDVDLGFVLDGFPRTVTQAVALDDIVSQLDPLIIIDIVVPDEELVRRLGMRRVCGQCGAIISGAAGSNRPAACERCGGQLVLRSDDTEEVVRERLSVYARDTKPLVDYYHDRLTFRSVEGNQSPDRVMRALEAAVNSAASVLEPVRRRGKR